MWMGAFDVLQPKNFQKFNTDSVPISMLLRSRSSGEEMERFVEVLFSRSNGDKLFIY